MAFSPLVVRRVGFGVFGLTLLLALGWVATQSGPLAPVQLTVTQVTIGDVSPSLFGIGSVEARRAYFIGPTMAGRVKRVLVDVGDAVRAGQLVAEMEPVDLDERVAASTSSLARGQSAVAAAEAQLRDAQSRQVLATIEERRAVDLGRAGVVSQSVVDVALQAKSAGDSQVAAAEAALAGARRDLARLEADRGSAQQQRANIRLVAPVDGVVTSRDAEPGSTVIAGQSVLKLQDPASLWVALRIDQGRSAGLVVGLTAHITRRSNPPHSLPGRVARVEPISDSVTEERLAKVAFDALPAGISIAEMVEVTLDLPVVRDALMVPNASIRYRGSQSGVWRLADGQLRFVPVVTGAEGLDGHVQVLDGLRAGDRVVVYSQRELTDASRFTVVPSLHGAQP